MIRAWVKNKAEMEEAPTYRASMLADLPQALTNHVFPHLIHLLWFPSYPKQTHGISLLPKVLPSKGGL